MRAPRSRCVLALFALAASALTLAPCAGASPDPLDPARRDLLAGVPSMEDGSLGSFANPAAWNGQESDFTFWWNDASAQHGDLDNWGAAWGGAFGISTQRFSVGVPGDLLRVQETRAGGAFGDRRARYGFAWRWAGGADRELGRSSGAEFGAVLRPTRRLSWGASTFLSVESSHRDALFDVAVRPLGDPRVALFADYVITSERRADEGSWSAGIALRPIAGVQFGGRIVGAPDEDPTFVAEVGLVARGIGFGTLTRLEDDGDRGATTFVLRANSPRRPIEAGPFTASPRTVIVDLEDRQIAPQRDLWFDDRVAWFDLARRLEAFESDPSVAGVVVNLAGARARPSVVWEMRESLRRLSRAGKEVSVHLERASMPLYYLASAADRISIDPLGEIRLPGLAIHRTYFRGLLDKLGLGFEEFRYFRYKSAVESYSRASMSDADREQYGRLVDAIYETVRSGVTDERGITDAEFDDAVESEGILTAAQAKERGLVDVIGRWTGLVDSLEAGGNRFGSADSDRARRWRSEERWGRPPTIAVVVAEGECAMDDGIRGRATSEHLAELAERRDVAAVVMRVDSPGGDPLPSDLVADAMARVREAKMPLVVTQGDVAASGGYLVSVEADKILTTPLTITGSIGVISGWVWDAGAGAKAGITADGVQRGSHADLFAGIRVPLLGARLPLRPLTDDERERARETTLELYDSFVSRVALARGRSEDEIQDVAEGRVWIGEDAIANGLCDDVGGFVDALADAKQRAGLEPDEEVLLEEFPARRRFRLPTGLTRLPRIGAFFEGRGESFVGGQGDVTAALSDESALRALRLYARSAGAPLLLLPPEATPAGWGESR